MHTLGTLQLLGASLAAHLAGFVNAIAGGGTLISFPALTFLGMSIVGANVTNTVALSVGMVGGTYAQREDLRAQGARLARLLPVAAAGGLSGGLLLLETDENLFRRLVPFLILLACTLLSMQSALRRWVVRPSASAPRRIRRAEPGPLGLLAVFVAAVYGGYFGAGLGIILLAVLGAVVEDDLVRVNALKQIVSLVVNVAAGVFFVFSGRIVWSAALLMALFALIGGHLGGKFAARLPAEALRAIVVSFGVVIAAVYFVR